MTLRIVLIEDEAAAVRRMRKLLRELQPEVQVLTDLPSVREAVAWFSQHEPPDLAILDVRLADGSSFEIFKMVVVSCPVIFVTAFDEFALQAFRVNALDYLLKPIKREELAAALDRLARVRTIRDLSALVQDEAAATDKPAVPVKRFLIRVGDRIRVVEPEHIAYIHARQKGTYLRTTEGKDLPLDDSLDRLECQLAPDRFFRLNRQLIVNFRSIHELHAYSKSRVKVVLEPPFDEDAVVSSERSAEFKRWLEG